jgi:uncharacterized protein
MIASTKLHLPQAEIERFCRRWRILELSLFGSALRDDFRADSDVDILVTFAPDARWSLFDMVRMQKELETILGREVDLVERSAVEQSENYIRRKRILSELVPVYAENRQALYDRAARVVGAFDDVEGATDLSIEHDRYLG